MWSLLLPGGIFCLDKTIKDRVEATRKLNEKQTYCKGRIIIQKYYNKGAALNFLEKNPILLLVLQTILALAVGIVFLLSFSKKDHKKTISYGMILGGGLSNLYDRYKLGYVVDYVSFGVKWKKLRNVVFNISDFFIFAGTILLLTSWEKEE